jgi:hypothetical protein
MALSIELGIARTYAIGVCFYGACALALLAGWWLSRRQIRIRPAERLVERFPGVRTVAGAGAASSRRLA